MPNYCALCGVKHEIGECCGGPKDIEEARKFLLDIIDVFSSDDERFAREAEIFRAFVWKVEPDKIPVIYYELIIGLAQGFRKVEGNGLDPGVVERLEKDRFK